MVPGLFHYVALPLELNKVCSRGDILKFLDRPIRPGYIDLVEASGISQSKVYDEVVLLAPAATDADEHVSLRRNFSTDRGGC